MIEKLNVTSQEAVGLNPQAAALDIPVDPQVQIDLHQAKIDELVDAVNTLLSSTRVPLNGHRGDR